jgi:hypothetical protein
MTLPDELEATQIRSSPRRIDREIAQNVGWQRRGSPVIMHDDPTAIGAAIDSLAALPFREAEAVAWPAKSVFFVSPPGLIRGSRLVRGRA